MPSGQERDWAYSIAPETRAGQHAASKSSTTATIRANIASSRYPRQSELITQRMLPSSAVRIVFFSFRIESNSYRRSQKSPIFVSSEPICVKWLHIRLRFESLDDTDDADDSTFVDFVGC